MRPTPAGIAQESWAKIREQAELQLAARNHGMPLEGLRYPITPIGMHYLLTHFDIPAAEEATWTLEIGGHVRQPRTLTMDEVPYRFDATARAASLRVSKVSVPFEPYASIRRSSADRPAAAASASLS